MEFEKELQSNKFILALFTKEHEEKSTFQK